MAFTGVQVDSLPQSSLAVNNVSCSITALILAARVGAPDPSGAAADSGVLVSAVAILNQNQIPANFGPGPGVPPAAGLWTQAQLDNLQVIICNPDGTALAAASNIQCVSRTLSAGNITLVFHNNGAGAVPAPGLGILLVCSF